MPDPCFEAIRGLGEYFKMDTKHIDICLDELRRLQQLYYEGKIKPGSYEHTKILMLEELESLFVKQKMKQLYEAELNVSARVRSRGNPECLTSSIH